MDMILSYERAIRLDDVYKTFSTEPLIQQKEFNAFYSADMNQPRGAKRLEIMKHRLQQSHGGLHYKAFLMGHAGVGKSTELTRLTGLLSQLYQPLRFSLTKELNSITFEPFDIVLWIAIELVKQVARPVAEGGADHQPTEKNVRKILEWFDQEEVRILDQSTKEASATAGAGVSGGSVWGMLLGLSAKVQSEMKYATQREVSRSQYHLARLTDLIEPVNSLLDECNDVLKKKTGKEWLIIGEDFDKEGVPREKLVDLYVNYGNIFNSLRAHMIFTIPIDLVAEYSPRLPFPGDRHIMVPDTPVYCNDAAHSPDAAGRSAIEAVIEKRMDPALFEQGQMLRLIVASGGNLRDLFSMISDAASSALIRAASTISPEDTQDAINNMRRDYTQRLGKTAFSRDDVQYPEKAERMVAIYDRDPKAKIADPVLYTLLRSRAVQEFNGVGWYGLHPIVVDILATQDYIKPAGDGKVPGGLI